MIYSIVTTSQAVAESLIDEIAPSTYATITIVAIGIAIIALLVNNFTK